MEDLFKKFVNAGVGFVSLTNDRVQKTIDSLVKESKLSEKEGAKIMGDLKKNTDAKRKELEKQAQSLAAKMLKTVGVAPNSELEELKRSTKTGGKPATGGSAATGSKKAAPSKAGSAAKGAVASATSKAASTVKKAADKTSAAAGKTQKSAAGSAGAAKKAENKADAADAKS
ncbi:phasin family protein [Hymenobacter actinosclerus]|uniref:Polyhydroxyalkanoate synthesis regulator phasin n=1 Tax=Hymenobacter actinosclerus TaxID=82805 RepID=A0A1I0BW51_9BACT|nr:hypothetical protein [Hymenobacter actinosclerus]SET11354.1 Polyhydroxyalkanoate synthesis regulator phasin [Hymenobacter actinosclerus]